MPPAFITNITYSIYQTDDYAYRGSRNELNPQHYGWGFCVLNIHQNIYLNIFIKSIVYYNSVIIFVSTTTNKNLAIMKTTLKKAEKVLADIQAEITKGEAAQRKLRIHEISKSAIIQTRLMKLRDAERGADLAVHYLKQFVYGE